MGIATGTRIIGIDRALQVVYIDKPLVDNIEAQPTHRLHLVSVESTSLTTDLEKEISFTSTGTGNTTLESNVYTVFDVPNADEFTTTPSMTATSNGVLGLNTATLYSSIMYAERFTNGPYNIQNNGDQIKITLNVALD